MPETQSIASIAGSASVAGSPRPTLRQAASELVNQVFYGTLMREMRDAQSDPLLGETPGGMAFIRQLDAELIKRMSVRGADPLTDTLVRRLEGSNAAGQSTLESSHQLLAGAGKQARQLSPNNLPNRTWISQ